MAKDLMVMLAFFLMVMSPCVIATHASLGEEGPDLGYAESFRRLRAHLIETLRI